MFKYLMIALGLAFVTPASANHSFNTHEDQVVVQSVKNDGTIIEARRKTTVRSHYRRGSYTKKGYRSSTRVRRHKRRY